VRSGEQQRLLPAVFLCFKIHKGKKAWSRDIHFGSREQMNPLSKKHISKCQKIRKKNSTCTSWHVMFVHKFLEEKSIFYVLYKKRQIYVWTYHYLWDIFLSFFMPHKMFFVVKNLCANIECPDWHAKFIFRIFWHLKFVFYAFFIIGSYTPES
jgi:hypothetical protein